MADDLGQFLGEDCPACGTPGPLRHLSAVGGCETCAESDPRPVFTPLRDAVGGQLLRAVRDLPPLPAWSPFRRPGRASLSRPRECYRLASGSMVHVKPGCRC